MENISVTESNQNSSSFAYLDSTLREKFGKIASVHAALDGNRAVIKLLVPENLSGYVKGEIEEKIADVITISYKYEYFRERIKPSGLDNDDMEILYCALISADVDDDKKYVKKQLESAKEYTVDGFYNFRLNALKRKWQEIVSYIPKYFDSTRLKDFIYYIIDEKKGKRVFVDGGKVYDKHFNLLQRIRLLPPQNNAKLLKESLLSGCGEVELFGKIDEAEEKFIVDYYGEKAVFSKKYYEG